MKQTSNKTKQTWLPALQSLRGIAFFLVYLCHSGSVDAAAFGVSIFFLISGFLLARRNYGETLDCSLSGCLSFSWTRIRKLYPLHVIMLLFYLFLLVRSMRSGAIPTTAGEIAVQFGFNLTLMQAWVPYKSFFYGFNGAVWFLSVLMFMYAISPPLLTMMNKLSLRKLFVMLLIVFAAYLAYSLAVGLLGDKYIPPEMMEWFVYICPLYRLGDFLVGCCLGCIYSIMFDADPRGCTVIPQRWALGAELVTLALMTAAFALHVTHRGILCRLGLGRTLLVMPPSALLVFCMATNRGGAVRWLDNRLTRFLGSISAAGFLIHWPVLTVFERVFRHLGLPEKGGPLYIAVCFVFTVLFSLAWNKIDNTWKAWRRSQ